MTVDFETRLSEALDDLADSIPVSRPVFDPGSDANGTSPSSSPPGRVGLLVACAAVVIGLVAFVNGVGLIGGVGSDTTGDAAADTDTTELIVWLTVPVSAEDRAAVEALLAADAEVVNARYVDQDETYEEFLEFFADEPELTALVEPEQLPTSFRVEFTGPGSELIDALLLQPGVVDVELPADEPSDSSRDLVADALDFIGGLNPFAD